MPGLFFGKVETFPVPTLSTPRGKLLKVLVFSAIFLLCLLVGYQAQPAQAEGSRNMYPVDNPPGQPNASRANSEWRNSSYGNNTLKRRTLFKVYANAGEYILMGSSAVGATPVPPNYNLFAGDIVVYNPGLVSGVIGQETIPATPSFSCLAQQAQTGNTNLGRIANRGQELAGPDIIVNPATGQTGGSLTNYAPCYYQAPVTGIYNMAFYGPRGDNNNSETAPTASIPFVAGNFDATQDTSVSSWDVTVRFRLDNVSPEFHGRLFSYYLTLYTGGNARPVYSNIYAVANDGYQYLTELRGLDPNGFVMYGNQVGFYDADGISPLYHDVLAETTAFNQNQLSSVQGGASLALPAYPIFFNPPDPAVLSALKIPLAPVAPVLTNFFFAGSIASSLTLVGAGGTFYYTSNTAGLYEIIISRDGVNFDPTNPLNRVLRGTRPAGAQSVNWDGRDNSGSLFPPGTGYKIKANVHAGEYHFPLIDAENSPLGGPTYRLINSPTLGCTNMPFGCTTAFYDDRGYRTSNGSTVWTVGLELCGSSPPVIDNGLSGFDSGSSQRAYGSFIAAGTNNGRVCNANPPGTGAFGDTKGLDIWTYFPSNAVLSIVTIVSQPPTSAPTPTPTPLPVINGPTPTPGGSSPTAGGSTPTPDSGNVDSTPTPTPTPDPGGSLPPAPTPPAATGGGSVSPAPLPGLPNTGRVQTASADGDSWLVLSGGLIIGCMLLGIGWLTYKRASSRR